MKKFIIYFLLFLSIVSFLYFELTPSLRIPEVNADEALVGRVTIELVNNLPTNDSLYFLGRHFPLATVYQHGALECYILAPFILFGGITAEALRIGPILFGVIAILLTYWFANRLFNPFVGVLSATLLAINSFFISRIKEGGVYGFSLPFFSLLSLSLFLKYINTRNNRHFYLGMFILGLGFNVKGYFIWFIVALFLSGPLFYRKIIKPKVCCMGFINLIIGASPILYHYFKSNFIKNFILRNFLVTFHNVNNLHFFKHILIRINQLSEVLARGDGSNLQFRGFSIFLFWVCIVLLLYKITFKKKDFPKRRISFLLVLTALFIIASSYTFTRHHIGHLIIIFPYIQIIISVAIWEVFKSNKFSRIIALLLAISLIGYHLKNCDSMIQHIRREEQENKNCNIYVITQWLLDNKFYNIVVFRRHDEEGFIFNSDLKINIVYVPPYLASRYYADKEDIHFAINNASPGVVFILENDGSAHIEVEESNNYFYTYARSLNKEVAVLKNFYRSCGDIKYTACYLK